MIVLKLKLGEGNKRMRICGFSMIISDVATLKRQILLNTHVRSGHSHIYPRRAPFKMALYTRKVLRKELL